MIAAELAPPAGDPATVVPPSKGHLYCDDFSMGPHHSLAETRPSMKWLIGGALFVGVVTACVHAPVLSSGALWIDDDEYLTENALVLNPSWDSVWRFASEVKRPSTVSGYYQPLPMISLMLDAAAGGSPTNLRPFHRTSLWLHSFNAAILAVLVYFLIRREAAQTETTSPTCLSAAIAAGLLFALHPMTVEAVAWVGERKTLLATMFALLCLVCHVRFTEKGSRRWYAAALACFLLGLLSKPTILLLPLLLLILDVWPLRRRLDGARLIEKAPYLLFSLVFGVIIILSQSHRAMFDPPTGREPGQTALLLCHNFSFYLQKIIWPSPLWPYYPAPDPLQLSNPSVLRGVCVTLFMVLLMTLTSRRTRMVWAAGLFFLIAIAPTLGLFGFSNFAAADKYAYFPAIGIVLLLSASALRWLSPASKMKPGLFIRGAAAAIIVAWASAEARTSRRQLEHWASTESLFAHVLRQAPDHFAFRFNHGLFLMEQDRPGEAAAEFQKTVELAPWYALAYSNLGVARLKLGNRDAAARAFREALRLDPNSELAAGNLRRLLMASTGLQDRLASARKNVSAHPESAAAHFDLARALADAQSMDEAILEYRNVLKIQPDHAQACGHLAILLAGKDLDDDAAPLFERAARLQPNSADAQNNYAVNLETRGQKAEAERRYRDALRLNPDHVDAWYNLSRLLLDAGRLEEARAACREALRIDPSNARARHRLDEINRRLGS